MRVTGIPTPVVKFYREGAEIQSSTDFRILQEGDLYSLLIAEAFPEDSGTYSVTATNSSGRATSTAELLVQGKKSQNLPEIKPVISRSNLNQLCVGSAGVEAVPAKKSKTIVATSEMTAAKTTVQRVSLPEPLLIRLLNFWDLNLHNMDAGLTNIE